MLSPPCQQTPVACGPRILSIFGRSCQQGGGVLDTAQPREAGCSGQEPQRMWHPAPPHLPHLTLFGSDLWATDDGTQGTKTRQGSSYKAENLFSGSPNPEVGSLCHFLPARGTYSSPGLWHLRSGSPYRDMPPHPCHAGNDGHRQGHL